MGAINGFIITLDDRIVNISFPELTRVFETQPSIVLRVSAVYSLLPSALCSFSVESETSMAEKNIY
jgi:hypothetical protein